MSKLAMAFQWGAAVCLALALVIMLVDAVMNTKPESGKVTDE